MATYYISPSGNNANSGAIGSPWATFNFALSGSSGVAAGDTILVRAGTYNQRIAPTISGTSGNPITLAAYPGETPTIAGQAGVETILEVASGREYLTFDGLRFSWGHAAPGGNDRFPWIWIRGGTTNHIILKNLQIERPGWEDLDVLATTTAWREWGIQIDNATQVTVDGCWIRGVNQGIQLKDNCYDATIRNCDIGYTKNSCITCTTSLSNIRRALIVNNLLHHSAAEDGIQFMQNFALPSDQQVTDQSNRGTQIVGNWIYDNRENAIDLKGAQNIVIQGNHIWGTIGSNNGPVNGWNRNSMGAIIRGANTSTSRVIIRNNNIYDNANGAWGFNYYKIYNNNFVWNVHDFTGSGSAFSPGTTSTSFTDIRQSENAFGLGIRNNIFSGSKQGSMALFAGNNQPATEVDLDYNLYSTPYRWIDRTASVVYTTLASWRTKLGTNNWRYGKDANSFTVANHAAIKFTNVPENPSQPTNNYDWTLLEDSPARGAGGPLTTTTGSGTSTNLTVVDSTWFSYGHGRSDTPGDTITVDGQTRTITAINDSTNTLTLDSAVTWTAGMAVWYGETEAADIGNSPTIEIPDPPPPDPPPTGVRRRAIVRVACSTSSGHQDIPIPDGALGADPTVWRFKVIRATADDTAAAGMLFSLGWAWDNSGSIVQRAMGLRSSDNVNPASTSRRGTDAGCILIYSNTSSSIDGEATFVSGNRTNVRINWSNPPGSAYHMIVEAMAPDAAYLATFDVAATVSTSAEITTGFAFTELEVATYNNAWNNGFANHRFSLGWATWDGSTLTQACIMRTSESTSPTSVFARLSNTQVGGNLDQNGSFTTALQIANPSSSGFDITTVVGNGVTNADGVVLALRFADQQSKIGLVTLPTSADNDFEIAVGFPVGFFEAITTSLQSLNSTSSTGDAGPIAYGAWDADREYGISFAERDNVTSSDTQSHSHQRLIDLDQHDGSAGIVGSVVGVDATDITLDITATLSPARYMLYHALEALEDDRVLTAGFSATPVSGLVPLTVNFTDESTVENTTITSWSWAFGDGDVSSVQNPTKQYLTPGAYSVSLTVSDGDLIDTFTRTSYISVEAIPPPPPPPLQTPQERRRRYSVATPRNVQIEVYAPISVGTQQIGIITNQVMSYQHETHIFGGFASARMRVGMPTNEAEDWYANGLARRIVTRAPDNSIVWEGFVNRISLTQGGYSLSIGPLMQTGNRAKLIYSIFDFSTGEAQGIRVQTGWMENTAAQDKYGIIERVLSAGGINPDEAEDLLALYVSEYSNPETSGDKFWSSSTPELTVELECLGYNAYLDNRIYTNMGAGTTSASAKVQDVVASVGIFSEDYSLIEPNSMLVAVRDNDDRKASTVIKDITNRGSDYLGRQVFGIYGGRRAVYRPVGESLSYFQYLNDATQRIYTPNGAEVFPWSVEPGRWLLVPDFYFGRIPVETELRSDPRAMLIESVTFTAPYQVSLTGAKVRRLDQKLARLGLSGIGA